MKFLISSTALLRQLQNVHGVISSNNTLPILDNYLFEVNKGKLIISASDLDTTISSEIALETKDSGKVAVPAKILMEYLKAFSEQPLNFSVDPSNFGIEISSDNGKFKLTGHNGSEFPKVPVIESSSSVDLKSDVLVNAINKSLFATGNDTLRPVMSGVFIELGPEGTIFVATDAHKLVRYKRSDAVSPKVASFIVPKKPLNLIKNVLATEQTHVLMEYNEKYASFGFNNVLIHCRLIDGKYPNYQAVIPSENPNKLTIDRNSFLNAIRRVSVAANKTTYQVKLNIKGSELQVSAEDVDYSNEAKERLTCQYEGEDMEIGFNSRFLMEMLVNLDSEEINLEMSAPNRAGILIPTHNASEHEDVLMLVMPVMINN